MPANTSPDNIIYPVSTDAVSPLETVFANMAQSVQDAITARDNSLDSDVAALIADAGTPSLTRTAFNAALPGAGGFTLSATQSASGSWVTIGGGAPGSYTELADPRSWHNPSSNATRFTMDATGVYEIIVDVEWADTSLTDFRGIRILKNTSAIRSSRVAPGPTGTPTGHHRSAVASMSAGDYFEVQLWQNSGSSLAVTVHLSIRQVA